MEGDQTENEERCPQAEEGEGGRARTRARARARGKCKTYWTVHIERKCDFIKVPLQS